MHLSSFVDKPQGTEDLTLFTTVSIAPRRWLGMQWGTYELINKLTEPALNSTWSSVIKVTLFPFLLTGLKRLLYSPQIPFSLNFYFICISYQSPSCQVLTRQKKWWLKVLIEQNFSLTKFYPKGDKSHKLLADQDHKKPKSFVFLNWIIFFNSKLPSWSERKRQRLVFAILWNTGFVVSTHHLPNLLSLRPFL